MSLGFGFKSILHLNSLLFAQRFITFYQLKSNELNNDS